MRLETLVYRDRCTLGEAARTLRQSGETDLSDAELARHLQEAALPGHAQDHPPGALELCLRRRNQAFRRHRE